MPFHRAHTARLNYAVSCPPVPADLYMLQYQESAESDYELLHRVHIPAELRVWFDEAQRHRYPDFGFHVESLEPLKWLSDKLPGKPTHMVTGIRMGSRTEGALPLPVVKARRFWWLLIAMAGLGAVASYALMPGSPEFSGAVFGVGLGAWATQYDLPRSPF